jgi:RNA polymerase sigma-70 factor (ECF subfamily)
MLFEELYAPLLNYANMFLNSTETAEELVQEAFLMIWEKRREVDDSFNIKAYLYKSVHNQALNFIRHQKVVLKHADSEYENSDRFISKAKEPNPFLSQALYKAIDELPQRARLIFQMSRIDGMRHKEIADELSISEKTVEVQVRKARHFLKKKLKRYYDEL